MHRYGRSSKYDNTLEIKKLQTTTKLGVILLTESQQWFEPVIMENIIDTYFFKSGLSPFVE